MLPVGEDLIDRMRAATRPNTKMYFAETVTNPSLFILDLNAFGKLGQETGIMTAVDATFSSPVNQVLKGR